MCETAYSCILIYYYIIFHTNNYKPTFAPPCIKWAGSYLRPSCFSLRRISASFTFLWQGHIFKKKKKKKKEGGKIMICSTMNSTRIIPSFYPYLLPSPNFTLKPQSPTPCPPHDWSNLLGMLSNCCGGLMPQLSADLGSWNLPVIPSVTYLGVEPTSQRQSTMIFPFVPIFFSDGP